MICEKSFTFLFGVLSTNLVVFGISNRRKEVFCWQQHDNKLHNFITEQNKKKDDHPSALFHLRKGYWQQVGSLHELVEGRLSGRVLLLIFLIIVDFFHLFFAFELILGFIFHFVIQRGFGYYGIEEILLS